MRKLNSRERRWLLYLLLLLAVVGWDRIRRRWVPTQTLETTHYLIRSTATSRQTEEIGQVAEMLYTAYRDCFPAHPAPRETRLKIKLFKDRTEFRLCNRVRGWAEGFYRYPYCYQYYSEGEVNPYHWLIHEATHQLNTEVAGLDLPRWLEEGIADYFGASRIISNQLALGEVDTNTYPVWWLDALANSGDLATDRTNGSLISLQVIVDGQGGPDLNTAFNLYYLHWWTLTHFLFHGADGRYRAAIWPLMRDGAGKDAFRRHVGDFESVEKEWYAHVQSLKGQFRGRATPAPVLRR